MHPECLDFFNFVKNTFAENFANKIVLEVGCGSETILKNNFFENCIYYSNDLYKFDKHVICCQTSKLDFPENYFDTIISSECFHCDHECEKSIIKIYQMLKPGGLFLFSCASEGRPDSKISYTQTGSENVLLFQNLKINDIHKFIDLNVHFSLWDSYYNSLTKDLYFYGIKRCQNQQIYIDIPKIYTGEHTFRTKQHIYCESNFEKYCASALKLNSYKETDFFCDKTNLKMIYTLETPKVLMIGLDNLNYFNAVTHLFQHAKKTVVVNTNKFLGHISLENNKNVFVENYFESIDETFMIKILADYGYFDVVIINSHLHQADCSTIIDFMIVVKLNKLTVIINHITDIRILQNLYNYFQNSFLGNENSVNNLNLSHNYLSFVL